MIGNSNSAAVDLRSHGMGIQFAVVGNLTFRQSSVICAVICAAVSKTTIFCRIGLTAVS